MSEKSSMQFHSLYHTPFNIWLLPLHFYTTISCITKETFKKYICTPMHMNYKFLGLNVCVKWYAYLIVQWHLSCISVAHIILQHWKSPFPLNLKTFNLLFYKICQCIIQNGITYSNIYWDIYRNNSVYIYIYKCFVRYCNNQVSVIMLYSNLEF